MSKARKEISLFPAQAESVPKQVVAVSTTFVQAEKESFREVVQRFTGAGDDDSQVKLPVTSKLPSNNAGWIGSEALARKPMHNLQERRQKIGKEMKQLQIKHNPFLFKRINGTSSPHTSSSEGVSPILLLLPPLLSSPDTPLSALSLDTNSPSMTTSMTHDQPPRYIRLEEGCSTLLAPPMPRTKSEPELLSLFPLTSPHVT